MKNILCLLLFFITISLFPNESTNNNTSIRGLSIFLTYPVTILNDDGGTSYPIGIGGGISLDLGGPIPIINLLGVEFSGSYTYLDNSNIMHYISSGLGFYLRSAFNSPLNIGLRSGFGGGLVISDKINPEYENNERTSGVYSFFSPFMEIRLFTNMYIQAGYESRGQSLELNEGNTTKHFDIYYLRTGVRF